MKLTLLATSVVAAMTLWRPWFTPDQQGDRLFKQENYAEAAEIYRDPMRVGVAWFRAGEFEKAEQAFSRDSSPEAEYNRGNCLIFRGRYEDAVERFDRALELKPGWEDARTNRSIAAARAKATKQEGGDMGDQKLGADKIVYDKEKSGGQDTAVDESKLDLTHDTQAMWLQRMQTRPADFLKAKFAYQLAMGEVGEEGKEPK